MFKLLDELRLNPPKANIHGARPLRTQPTSRDPPQPLQQKNKVTVLTSPSCKSDALSEY
jgi:hypothetical protein